MRTRASKGERERAAERAQKLLQLAAPSGQSTLPERTSAALEAAKMVDDYALTVVASIKPARERKNAPPADHRWTRFIRYQPPKVSPWIRVLNDSPSKCVTCGEEIPVGVEAWFDPNTEQTIHYDITCGDK